MNNIWITIFGILFIFFMTTLGAALVSFFSNSLNKKFNSLFLGFASGVMISASIWSLLIPSIEICNEFGNLKIIPSVIGFLIGTLFLIFVDKFTDLINHKKNGKKIKKKYYKKRAKLPKKIKRLFVAVTIHNIPEGLAVGFAFGTAFLIGTDVAFLSALGLSIGIGIQNFPEGMAVALPIKEATKSKKTGFLYGFLSGAVEPIFAVIGFFMASKIQFLEPWLMAFSAGAMMFVVVEDLIPEAHKKSTKYISTLGFVVGFCLMMILDIAFG